MRLLFLQHKVEFCAWEKQHLESSPLGETEEEREEIGRGGLKDIRAVPTSPHLTLENIGLIR